MKNEKLSHIDVEAINLYNEMVDKKPDVLTSSNRQDGLLESFFKDSIYKIINNFIEEYSDNKLTGISYDQYKMLETEILTKMEVPFIDSNKGFVGTLTDFFSNIKNSLLEEFTNNFDEFFYARIYDKILERLSLDENFTDVLSTKKIIEEHTYQASVTDSKIYSKKECVIHLPNKNMFPIMIKNISEKTCTILPVKGQLIEMKEKHLLFSYEHVKLDNIDSNWYVVS